jgi:uncharacterized membrane protein
MQSLIKIILNIHVACGALVLLLGLLQMILRKSGRIHRTLGNIYFYAMVVIFFTSFPISIIHSKWFLTFVAIFSLHLVWTGQRQAHFKEKKHNLKMDKAIAIGGLICGISMLALAIIFLLNGNSGFAIVPAAFGWILLLNVRQDLRQFFSTGKNMPPAEMHWIFNHISRMIGSYIAAVTAFLANVQPFGDSWINWILPTAIGAVIITFFIRFYKKKFNLI